MQNTPATSSTAPRIRQAVRTANAKTAPPALPRAPLLHGLNRAVLWQLAACGTGLLLSAGQVYGGAAPFGLGLLLGCGNTYAPAAALGCLAGLLLFQPLDTALKLAGACIGALTARIVGRQLGQTGFLPGAACGVGVLLLEQGLVTLVGGASPADTASLLCSAALAVLVGLGIHKLHIGTPRGACLWAAMAAACLQRAALPGFAPGLAGAAFCILCCACAGSLEHTAVLALVLAMALTAAAPALCFAALAVAAGGLGTAVFCPGERRSGAAVFAAGCALGALAAPNLTGVLTLGLAAGAGLLGFLLCPEQALRAVFPPPAPPVGTQSLTSAARKLSSVADTLSDIAETVNAVCSCQMPPRGESYDYVVEFCAQHLCQNCARRNTCWVQGYSTAMDGLYALRGTLEHNGRVELEDLPGQLSTCVHPADLCATVSHGYRLWCSRRQTRARAELLRTALTEQYSALAGALAQLAGKLGQAGLPDPRREAKVAQLFADLGLDALECSVTADLAGRLTASVTICRTHFTQDEVRGLTDEVSRICRRDMDTPEITHCRTVTMLTFGERPLFTVEFGAAAHAASGQPVSGDALDQFCDTGGRAQMLLCDGMGTGRAAAVDGQMAAKLTAQLLRAGFAAESAARLVNVALGLKGAEQEAGATLDLLTVDLYTGRAGLFKAGAAPSFLVRGGVPRMLDGASLPMGVLDSLVGRSTTFALDAGDWVVLVSDGALTDGSDWLMQQLQLCAKLGHTPKQAAETVADAAACRAGEKRDDITVAVLAMGKRA